VQQRSQVAADPTQPNLRQVHLLHAELFAEFAAQGFAVQPGQLGENITTGNLDLLAPACGTQLRIGPEAVVEVTGLRNPCAQINAFQPRLLNAVLGRDGNVEVARKAGIMGIVVAGSRVMPGDGIVVRLPADPPHALERV
jgi:MOSC domain-containing protein YiiM